MNRLGPLPRHHWRHHLASHLRYNYHPRTNRYCDEPSAGVQAPPLGPGRVRSEFSPKEVVPMFWLAYARALT